MRQLAVGVQTLAVVGGGLGVLFAWRAVSWLRATAPIFDLPRAMSSRLEWTSSRGRGDRYHTDCTAVWRPPRAPRGDAGRARSARSSAADPGWRIIVGSARARHADERTVRAGACCCSWAPVSSPRAIADCSVLASGSTHTACSRRRAHRREMRTWIRASHSRSTSASWTD
jgi:hypothetical protein